MTESQTVVSNRGKVAVLVVDDEPTNRRVFEQLLNKLGCEVAIAGTWPDVERHLEQRLFDLILMDLRMPEMDGFEMLRRLKQRSDFDAIRVHAMTGDASIERNRQVDQAGFHGFLPKPFTMANLKQTLQQLSDSPS